MCLMSKGQGQVVRSAYYRGEPRECRTTKERVAGTEDCRLYSAFYPLSIFISSIFVLFTIFIYFIIKDLRKNIFGKLILGLLINLFIANFTAGIIHSWNYMDQRQCGTIVHLGTWGCIVSGYILQHTYVAILFWTNAMAFTLIKTFSNVLLHSAVREQVESKKKVFLTIIYAQGRQFTYYMIRIMYIFDYFRNATDSDFCNNFDGSFWIERKQHPSKYGKI